MKTYNKHKAHLSRTRKDQLDSGYFDGRFVQRTEKDRKKESNKKWARGGKWGKKNDINE